MSEVHVNEKAFALRPIRIRNDRYVCYGATTFPRDPRGGCSVYLRRAAVCGGVIEGGVGPLGIDVLDEDGDILQTFTVSQRAFEYLRAKLKFKVEP